MEKEKDGGIFLYVLKILLFALLFIGISAAICAVWTVIGGNVDASADGVITPVVVIDAGHGGIDGGAVALSPVPEKELNLDIALALRDMLTASGIDVVMTRDSDVMLSVTDPGVGKKTGDLLARRRIAEATEGAVFVSIHMNSFPAEKYHGLQVWYSQNSDESKALAEKIQSTVHSALGNDCGRSPKAATSSIYLLKNLTCPAVLVECGFLSNAGEAALLNDEEYRDKLALVISAAVSEYISGGGT